MRSAGECQVKVCKGLLKSTFELTGMRLQSETRASLARSRMSLQGGQTFKGPSQLKLVFAFINKLSCPGPEAILSGFSPSIIF